MIVTNSTFDDKEKMHYKTARVLKILGDPNRIKIVKLLAKGELCQCEIIPIIEQSQPTVSRHLKLLEENGILFSRKDGVKMLYRIADPNILKIVDLAASIGRV